MTHELKEFTSGRGYGKEDWDEVGDPHEPTDAQLALAKPFSEMFPDLAVKPETPANAKATEELVSLRLDSDVLSAYRASGPGWESRINAVLRAALRPRAKD